MAAQQLPIRMTAAHIRRLGDVLARAFHDEPNFSYMVPDVARRHTALDWFFTRIVVGLGYRYGEVYTTPTAAGAAVWLAPGASIPAHAALTAGMATMPWRFGWRGFRRSLRVNAELAALRQQLAPTRHWYLLALGVEPQQQGQGIGSRLLQPVLARADSEGLPCYLETFTLQNARFYQRHRFTRVAEAAVAPDGPPYWTMLRRPLAQR